MKILSARPTDLLRIPSHIRLEMTEERISLINEADGKTIVYATFPEIKDFFSNLRDCPAGISMDAAFEMLSHTHEGLDRTLFYESVQSLLNDGVICVGAKKSDLEILYEYMRDTPFNPIHLGQLWLCLCTMSRSGFRELSRLMKQLDLADRLHPGYELLTSQRNEVISSGIHVTDLVKNRDEAGELARLILEARRRRETMSMAYITMFEHTEFIESHIIINGEEILRECVERGGVFLFSHFGAYELGIFALLAMGYELTIIADNEAHRNYEMVSKLGRPIKIRVLTVPDEFIVVKSIYAVRGGACLFVAMDHSTSSHRPERISVPFLGAEITLPDGPFLIAEHADVPIVYFSCKMMDEEDGRLELSFLRIEAGERRDAVPVQAARLLEHQIRNEPALWSGSSNFLHYMLSK